MKVVIGIGNPGAEYEDTRHNVGYMAVEKAAAKLGATFGRSPYRAAAARGRRAGEEVTLLKPLTFVNLSGETARLALKALGVKPAEGLLVVVDDADLEPGVVRFRAGGGAGGHNGLASIMEAAGADFARLRIGIGRSDVRLRDHVLSQFAPEERDIMNAAVETAADAVLDWVAKGLPYCQNVYNRKKRPDAAQQPQERS